MPHKLMVAPKHASRCFVLLSVLAASDCVRRTSTGRAGVLCFGHVLEVLPVFAVLPASSPVSSQYMYLAFETTSSPLDRGPATDSVPTECKLERARTRTA